MCRQCTSARGKLSGARGTLRRGAVAEERECHLPPWSRGRPQGAGKVTREQVRPRHHVRPWERRRLERLSTTGDSRTYPPGVGEVTGNLRRSAHCREGRAFGRSGGAAAQRPECSRGQCSRGPGSCCPPALVAPALVAPLTLVAPLRRSAPGYSFQYLLRSPSLLHDSLMQPRSDSSRTNPETLHHSLHGYATGPFPPVV